MNRDVLRHALLCAALWTCAAANAAVTVPDHRGRTLTLPAPPQRIVTLLPSLTESVCALGGCARLVGTDRFSNAPAEVKALPKLGGLEDAQIERIVALKPDVVLAAPSARVIGRLEQLGLKVLVIESNTHAEVRRAMETLSVLLGAPEQADLVWRRIEQDIQAASARVPLALRGSRVYFEIDGSPYAAGAGSFIGETIARLGLGNIAPPELGPFPRLNPEFIVRAQPDLVMADRRSFAEMPRRPGWTAIKAVRTRRGCGFSAERYELLVRPGPRMGEGALVLADCLAGLDKVN